MSFFAENSPPMSENSQSAYLRRLPALAAILALGIYWFQADGRKATPTAPAATGVSRALSTGAMAAFLVMPDRVPPGAFTFQDRSGASLGLAAWRGRVVLVNLWATWCAPCRREMPALDRLQKKLGGPRFEVLAISVDRKGAEASEVFLEETGTTSLALYVDPASRAIAALKAPGLPLSVLLDRNGNEIGRLIGPAEWDSDEAVRLIEAALAETSTNP